MSVPSLPPSARVVRRLSGTLLAVLASAGAPSVAAQSPASAPDSTKVVAATAVRDSTGATAAQAPERPFRRQLGQHVFIPSALVSDPFVATYFRTGTGGGMALDVQVPIYNLEDSLLGTGTGNIGFLVLEFQYQQVIGTWFAARGYLSATARAGTNATAILAEGLSAVYGGAVGGTARLWQNDRFYLSAVADYAFTNLTQVTPLEFVANVAEYVSDSVAGGGGIPDSIPTSELLTTGSSPRLTAGFRAAYAAAPWLGFTVQVQGGWTEPFDKEAPSKGIGDVGGTAGVDFGKLSTVPVGVLLSARGQSVARGTELGGGATSFGLGLFYTGRREFSIGLETTLARVDQREVDKTTNVVLARFLLRYDF